ncbi:MAG: tRNA-dihydrouridine synthase [Candidatus Shapirobacteria bacterium]
MKYVVGLSPMDGITDAAFRLTQIEIAKPDIMFTEFVSAEGIAHNAVKLFDQLLYSSKERPIIGQLFGKDPDSFYLATIILCHLGFDGIDINMGCPAKKVTQHGSGAALIDKPEVATKIILATKKGIADYQNNPKILSTLNLKQKVLDVIDRNLSYSGSSPVNGRSGGISFSIKTRIGTSESVVDTWIKHLCSFSPDFITLHGRTLKMGYSGVANWQEIAKAAIICHESNIKIFGNGDLLNRQMANEYCAKYGTDGALIGRAAMGNPWLFDDKTVSFKDKYQAMLTHARHFVEIFPSRRFDPLRHHFLLYVSGHPNASALRQEIVKLTSIDQLCALEDAICG